MLNCKQKKKKKKKKRKQHMEEECSIVLEVLLFRVHRASLRDDCNFIEL